jgi:hypothetical protein
MSDGREAWVDIASLEILHGSVPRREVKDALEWAASNKEFLLKKFKEFNQ